MWETLAHIHSLLHPAALAVVGISEPARAACFLCCICDRPGIALPSVRSNTYLLTWYCLACLPYLRYLTQYAYRPTQHQLASPASAQELRLPAYGTGTLHAASLKQHLHPPAPPRRSYDRTQQGFGRNGILIPHLSVPFSVSPRMKIQDALSNRILQTRVRCNTAPKIISRRREKKIRRF